MKKICLVLFLVLTTFGVASSSAQTLINQSNISSFPYVITSSGSYKLTSNLTVTVPQSDGIYIIANDVTLDLNGYTISGAMTCSGGTCNSNTSTGISAMQSGVIIKNGFVKGFASCVSAESGLVEDINASACQYGIYDVAGTIHHSSVSNNSQVGIQAYYAVVTENSIYGNSGYGIITSGSSVLNNSIISNPQYGLYLGYGSFAGNTIISNGTDLYTYGTAISSKTNACTSGSC